MHVHAEEMTCLFLWEKHSVTYKMLCCVILYRDYFVIAIALQYATQLLGGEWIVGKPHLISHKHFQVNYPPSGKAALLSFLTSRGVTLYKQENAYI